MSMPSSSEAAATTGLERAGLQLVLDQSVGSAWPARRGGRDHALAEPLLEVVGDLARPGAGWARRSGWCAGARRGRPRCAYRGRPRRSVRPPPTASPAAPRPRRRAARAGRRRPGGTGARGMTSGTCSSGHVSTGHVHGGQCPEEVEAATRKRAASAGGSTVADRPIRCSLRPHRASRRSSERARWAPRLLPTRAWISSTMTCSQLAEDGPPAVRGEQEVERLGVVMRRCGGCFEDPRALAGRSSRRCAGRCGSSAAGVPRRRRRPRCRAAALCRLRSTSAPSALSGEMEDRRRRPQARRRGRGGPGRRRRRGRRRGSCPSRSKPRRGCPRRGRSRPSRAAEPRSGRLEALAEPPRHRGREGCPEGHVRRCRLAGSATSTGSKPRRRGTVRHGRRIARG